MRKGSTTLLIICLIVFVTSCAGNVKTIYHKPERPYQPPAVVMYKNIMISNLSLPEDKRRFPAPTASQLKEILSYTLKLESYFEKSEN